MSDNIKPRFMHDIDGDRWLTAEGEDRFSWVVKDLKGNIVEPDDTVPFVWPGPFRAWLVDPGQYTISKNS